MNRSELNKFVQQCIYEQGSASSMALSELMVELMKHIPCVIHVSKENLKYKITNSQKEIDTIIDAITKNEVSSICVYSEEVTIHFPQIEVHDDIVTCYLTTVGGNYTLLLTKESNQSEFSKDE